MKINFGPTLQTSHRLCFSHFLAAFLPLSMFANGLPANWSRSSEARPSAAGAAAGAAVAAKGDGAAAELAGAATPDGNFSYQYKRRDR